MLYLIVAHQTAVSPELAVSLKEIAATDQAAEFVLLVPATRVSHLLTWVEGESEGIAKQRATEASAELRSMGLNVVEAIVGPAEPLQAVVEEHERKQGQYARVIIGTLPVGISRWLRKDLAARVRRQLGVDVTQVVATTGMARVGSTVGLADSSDAVSYPLDLTTLSRWRGRQLYCLDGVLGDINEIVYDYVSREPVWLGVESNPLPFRTLLAPAAGIIVEDEHLTVSLTRAKLLAQPPVELGEGFASLTEEERIYDYFGLAFNELRDVRVLRIGQEVPGLEWNQQHILAS